MIYVRIELWPGGDPRRRRLLGHATISNTGGGTPRKGSYVTRLYGQFGRLLGTKDFEGFPRRRLGAWDLLLRALLELRGGRGQKRKLRGLLGC